MIKFKEKCILKVDMNLWFIYLFVKLLFVEGKKTNDDNRLFLKKIIFIEADTQAFHIKPTRHTMTCKEKKENKTTLQNIHKKWMQ